MLNLKNLRGGCMSGYQDFVRSFGNGKFIKSNNIRKKYSLQKALASLYIIPTFFRGIYYIPTKRERKAHFIEKKQDFFTFLFNFKYGRKKWYWALSTAARAYGIEWSSTKILEIVTKDKSKTVNISEKIRSLEKKRSYRSLTLAKYLLSLEINALYIHKQGKKIAEIKIHGEMGPISTKKQILKDIERFLPKTKNKNMKRIYKRILQNLKNNPL